MKKCFRRFAGKEPQRAEATKLTEIRPWGEGVHADGSQPCAHGLLGHAHEISYELFTRTAHGKTGELKSPQLQCETTCTSRNWQGIGLTHELRGSTRHACTPQADARENTKPTNVATGRGAQY